ncbi:hypothetical protein OROHE_021471 [Orobanche hederae]
MVRRDWSFLSKDIGDYCLSQILSGGSYEEVFESIHATLVKVQEEMRNGQIALEKYVIVKTLTKAPEAYPDAKNQPHVQCEDETCKYTTRSLNMGVLGDSERGTVCPNYHCCNGRLARKYTERDLYRQLSYFCYILDTVPCTEKIKGNSKIAAEKEEARIKPVVELAAKTVQKIRDRCSYRWEVPGLNVRINLPAPEILKLADHIIAKSKKVHDAVASVPLDKGRPKKFMFVKYEWKVLLAVFLLCLIEVFSASFGFYLIEVRGCYIFSAFLIDFAQILWHILEKSLLGFLVGVKSAAGGLFWLRFFCA